MGTNYYAIPKADDYFFEEIKRLADDKNLLAIKSLCNQFDEVHIGKSSAGWEFTFNYNYWDYFDKSESSLRRWLKKCLIKDEYGQEKTYVEFWDMVNSKKGGLKGLGHKFEVDGLVFSDSCHFS